MALLNSHHDDELTAALSIAANRADKISLLRESGLDDIARDNAASLIADVDDFIKAGGFSVHPHVAEELRKIAHGA